MNDALDALSQCHANISGSFLVPSYDLGTTSRKLRLSPDDTKPSFTDVPSSGPYFNVGHAPPEYAGYGGGSAGGGGSASTAAASSFVRPVSFVAPASSADGGAVSLDGPPSVGFPA